MAELFKNIYNQKFFHLFQDSVQEIIPDFNSSDFLNDIYAQGWEDKELKQRMRHITITLHQYLSDDYKENTEIILKLIPVLIKNGFKADNLEFIFLPDYIEVYGMKDYDVSIHAFEYITQFVSCEFAVRPFIISYQDQMIEQMMQWSNHKHPSVRRLASEGSRPRLPWGMALPSFKKNPAPIIPILENLKNDISDTVRRSVANNLNDISKDNPSIVLDIVNKWIGKSKEIDALCKHASRTLLKQGNSELMEVFGFGSISKITLSDFKIITPRIRIEESVEFSFILTNTSLSSSKIRLEYGLYYQKANGSLSKKVFKISEKEYAGNSSSTISRKQSFKIITTRKFHLGLHQVSIIVNGSEFEKLDFHLVE